MKKLLLIALVLFCTTLAAQRSPDLTVYFDSDSWQLDHRAKLALDSFCIAIKNRPDLQIKMTGHTDSIADADYNQQLSEKRVSSVKRYLEQKGVNAKIESAGYAYSRPAANNSTAAGRQSNRRVEILIVAPVQKPAATLPVVKDVLRPIVPESTIVRGERGTIIKIPEGAFGKIPNSSVDIQVREYFDMLRCANCNITTTTNAGQCLQTGGMVFLTASSANIRIDSLTGQAMMQIWIPADSVDTSMHLYESTPLPNGFVGWKPSPRKVEIKEDGKKYYVFETNVFTGCNIDRVARCPVAAKDTFISTGRFKGGQMMKTTNNTSAALLPKSSSLWQETQLSDSTGVRFVSVASKRGNTYKAVVCFSDLKKKTRRGRTYYKIRRKFYVKIKKEFPSGNCAGLQ